MDRKLIDDCEARFAELSERFGCSDLTEAQFKELVEKLQVRDSKGALWRLSSVTGDWERQDGSKWITGGKPADAVEPGGEHPARKDLDAVLPEPPPEKPPHGVKGRLGQVVRYALGAILIVFGVGRPMLGLVGAKADGVVIHISCETSTEDNNRSDDISISYDFTLPNGRKYSGLSQKNTKRFGSAGASQGQSVVVRYMPGFPYFNAASWDAKLSYGYVLIAGVGILIVTPTRWWRRKRRQ